MEMQRLHYIVASKLVELNGIPHGKETGRRLELGGVSEEQMEQLLTQSFLDIGTRLSPALLETIPAVALEQLVVMSVSKGHDTAGLIKSLINSFLVSYITPETNDRAFHALETLEHLRSQVAQTRVQQPH